MSRTGAYILAPADAREAEMASWLSSAEVARLMSRTGAEVTALRKQGELYASRRPKRALRIPHDGSSTVKKATRRPENGDSKAAR